MKITINPFQNLCGDCLLVSLQRKPDVPDQHINIDAGFSQTYHRILAGAARRIVGNDGHLHLFVLTHTDNNHLGGAIPFLKKFGSLVVDRFWMNHAPITISADNRV